MVSGTGLTHKASAENRSAMHKQSTAEITDSMRMYQMGLEAGNPVAGQIGVQPEWFYKGDGSILRAHGEDLEIPPYGWDGGEEPEIAGAYVISRGWNAFSRWPDRRQRVFGPSHGEEELSLSGAIEIAQLLHRAGARCRRGNVRRVPGTVKILRGSECLWQKNIRTGQDNMSYSVANLEHHHFKYAAHRRAGDVHIHFFGADAFSFGDGLALEQGDVMEVSFPQFGRPLRNRLTIRQGPEKLVAVSKL